MFGVFVVCCVCVSVVYSACWVSFALFGCDVGVISANRIGVPARGCVLLVGVAYWRARCGRYHVVAVGADVVLVHSVVVSRVDFVAVAFVHLFVLAAFVGVVHVVRALNVYRCKLL